MSTRLNLDDFNHRVYQALEDTDSQEFQDILRELGTETPDYLANHLGAEHSTPSPSGLTTCHTQLWYKNQGVEEEHSVPAAWKKRAAVGSMTELLWIALIRLAGYDVTLAGQYECGPYMRGHPDGWIPQDFNASIDQSLDKWGILELKDLTGWTYKRIIEEPGGIRNSEMQYYTQVQMYMYATKASWALFFASPADPAHLQSNMRRYKKYGQSWTLPLFYTEIVERDEAHIEASLNRAESIATLLSEITPPPREYDGITKWPCQYCPFQKRCNEEFGNVSS